MPQKESPALPLTFKFSNPPVGGDPDDLINFYRQEMERMIEYTNDHVLALRQEIEELRNGA